MVRAHLLEGLDGGLVVALALVDLTRAQVLAGLGQEFRLPAGVPDQGPALGGG